MNDRNASYSTAVVLSTYNGSRFIVDQLDSIRLQSIQVDHVYIFDDQSTDNTAETICEYIEKWNLQDSWSFCINKERKGWRKNFIEGCDKVDEELIFLCDQDDIWPVNKIEVCKKLFAENPKMNVLRGKPLAFYENGEIVNNEVSVYPCYEEPFSIKEFDINAPGCAICFKNLFYKSVRKYWASSIPHDAFVLHMGRAGDSVFRTDTITVFHREHNSNTMVSESNGTKYCEYNLKVNKVREEIIKSITSFFKDNPHLLNENKEQTIEEIIHWLNARNNFLKERNALNLINLAKYIKCYRNVKRFCGDIYRAILNKSIS